MIHTTNSHEKGRPGGTGAARTTNARKCTACACETQSKTDRMELWMRFAVAAFPAIIRRSEYGLCASNEEEAAAWETARYATAMVNQMAELSLQDGGAR